MFNKLYEKIEDDYIGKWPNFFGNFIYISLEKQKLYYIVNGFIKGAWNISTNKLALFNHKSNKATPYGLHHIEQKIGYGVPYAGILENGKYTKKKATIHFDNLEDVEQAITSRIFWLAGDEPGLNKGGSLDAYSRKIYIHGTSEEGKLGLAGTQANILMPNDGIIELFNKAYVGMKVLIIE